MDSLIFSNALNYQDVLESTFDLFLRRDGSSDKTRENYLTDLRHFLSWLVTAAQTANTVLPKTHQEFLQHVTEEHLEDYKRTQLLNHTPIATINRRLSAIRTFFRACLQQGWILNNPTLQLKNIPKPLRISPDALRDVLGSYAETIQGKPGEEKQAELDDIEAFIVWLIQREQTPSLS